MENTLYYGDNLYILRQYIKSETIDLIYLDPPFNSSRNYNILFKDEKGKEADSQIIAFEDTWHWTQKTEEIYNDLVTQASERISNLIGTLRSLLGTSQMMAYLVMMTARLAELHRVLKPTGSIFLHCDPTASHYLKIILDTIFGPQNFSNHITWQRSDTHNDAKKQFSAISDHILFYRKSDKLLFNKQHTEYPEKTLKDWYQYLQFSDGTTRHMTKEENESQQIPDDARRFNIADITSPNPRPNLMYNYKGYSYPPNGWRYSLEQMKQLDEAGLLVFPAKPDGRIMRKRFLDEQKGVTLGDVWVDISQIRANTSERLGYPTQKPLALLERIITAASQPGDVVLDPFCGCGTAIAAAEKLGRKWIGIDITHLSIALQKFRMQKMFPSIAFKIIGEPTDIGAARQLATDDRYQFQWWALSLVKAQPLGGETSGSRVGKKGSDKGIDGIITFIDDSTGKPKRAIVQVKSGKVSSALIRDLRGTLEREKAAIAAFITLENPTRDMLTEAASAGFYDSPGWGKKYPKIQILTVEDLMKGKSIFNMPPSTGMFKAANRATRTTDQAQQGQLFEDEDSNNNLI